MNFFYKLEKILFVYLILLCEKCYRVLKVFFFYIVCMYMYMKIKRYGICIYIFIVINIYDK